MVDVHVDYALIMIHDGMLLTPQPCYRMRVTGFRLICNAHILVRKLLAMINTTQLLSIMLLFDHCSTAIIFTPNDQIILS